MPVVLSGVSPENNKQLGVSPLLREPANSDTFNRNFLRRRF